MSRLAKLIVVSLSVLILAYIGLGYVLGKTNDGAAYRPLTVFSEVLQRVQQEYVDEPNLPLVTSGALHGLLESLDPESSYFSPREFAEYKKKSQNGAKGEVGAALSKRYGYITVISVLPDSPAQKAGLRNGDILEAIAGFTTREMSIGQAQILLTAEPGATVKVSVVRRGRIEPQEVELTRAVLTPPRVQVERMEGEIAYLHVPALNAGKANETRETLLQLERQGAHKLVLDLRDCASGEASEGIAAARLFLTSGTITTLRGQTVATQEFAADPAQAVWKGPMTVLIGNSTSGAAELLAAAIADNGRGDAVGVRTFGTASEQKLIPLEDGAALVLTVANYYTPAGKSIPDEGVSPTVEVRGTGDDLLDSGDEDQPPSAQLEQPSSRDDPVLKKALQLLQAETRKAA